MDDFEFFHRKKFLDLTLETVNTHSSAVRYQVSSDEEDLVMEHTDTEYRSDRRASGSHLIVDGVNVGFRILFASPSSSGATTRRIQHR